MLFCFTYFSFLWWACIVSQLKQLQLLVENKHSCYIYCNIEIYKKDIKKLYNVVLVCSITYLFLIFYSFCSNPSEVKHRTHKTIINLSTFWSYQTILG